MMDSEQVAEAVREAGNGGETLPASMNDMIRRRVRRSQSHLPSPFAAESAESAAMNDLIRQRTRGGGVSSVGGGPLEERPTPHVPAGYRGSEYQPEPPSMGDIIRAGLAMRDREVTELADDYRRDRERGLY